MKKSRFHDRLKALREQLPKLKADTLWIVQPENRRYLSGFKAVDGQLNESSGSLIINKKKTILITDTRYTTEAQKEAVDFDVVTQKKSLFETLPDMVARLRTKVLAFDEGHVTWQIHQQMARRLRKLKSPVRLTPLKGLVEKMREIKDPSEIRAMKRASDLMSDILGEIIPNLEPGRTEREIAWEIEGLAREGGADDLAFQSIVASGPNSALPHAVPTKRNVRAKEPIILDVGVKIDGYACDMTRTIFLERPGPKFRKIYKTVMEAQLSAMPEVRPGINSTYPDSIARRVIAEAGFGEYFGHSLGHGVGLATHEAPRLGPENPVALKRHMVVTVEPGIYLPGKGGVRLEQMVVVEKNGPKVLTKDNHFYDF